MYLLRQEMVQASRRFKHVQSGGRMECGGVDARGHVLRMGWACVVPIARVLRL